MQPCEGTRNRFWYDCGGDLLYQVWPKNKANPLYDSGVAYHHEAVITSAAIDMGTAAKLSKYIKQLVGFTKNLTPGIYAAVGYQVDDKVGTTSWKQGGAFTHSPEDRVDLDADQIGRFAYRLILNTNDENTPPDIQGVIPSGFARSPFKLVWNLRVTAGIGYGSEEVIETLGWLYRAAEKAVKVTISSEKYSQLNGKTVIVVPPDIQPTAGETLGKNEKAVINLKLIEA